MASYLGSVAQLAAELGGVDAMLGGFSRAQKNDRDVVVVAGAKVRVFVDIDFREARAEFFQQGSDLRLGLFAEVAAGARIDRDVARARRVAGGRLRCARRCPALRRRATSLARPVATRRPSRSRGLPDPREDISRAPGPSKAARIFCSSEFMTGIICISFRSAAEASQAASRFGLLCVLCVLCVKSFSRRKESKSSTQRTQRSTEKTGDAWATICILDETIQWRACPCGLCCGGARGTSGRRSFVRMEIHGGCDCVDR